MAKTKVEGFSSLRNAFGGVLSVFILLLIEVLPFSIHLFSVIKYESVIHEFDPYFNYKVTQFLSKNSIYEFWNWFDNRTWYPLGCVIGGTVYPGLALTTGTMWCTIKEFIGRHLEKELDKLGASRNAIAISTADVSNEVVLGTQGTPFSFFTVPEHDYSG